MVHSSSARQEVIVFLGPACMGFNTFVLPKSRPGLLCSILGDEKKRSRPGRTPPPSPRPAPLRLAAPRPAPRQPISPRHVRCAPLLSLVHGMSVFWI